MNNHLHPTIERFTGFAETYDRHRPPPPDVLSDILIRYAHAPYPRLVVDLGCGTGLSTRYWAEWAAQVVGIDPSLDMLRQARVQTRHPNVAYLLGFSHQTGLASGCADIITCSQSLHWMEPESTLAEIARLLRPGGVFAAYDHDHYPIFPDWRAEQAYRKFRQRMTNLDEKHHITQQVGRWPKSEHLSRMQKSGYFCFTRELELHQVLMGNAERLVGLALSYGSVQSLLKAGLSESDLGLDTLRIEAAQCLGNEPRPWYWSTRLRLGVV
jgi:ubiquinone/menaquinone biosynthesis C-methylase UbiE